MTKLTIIGIDKEERLLAVKEGAEFSVNPGEIIILPNDYNFDAYYREDDDFVITQPNAEPLTVKAFFSDNNVEDSNTFARNFFASSLFGRSIVINNTHLESNYLSDRLSKEIQIYNKEEIFEKNIYLEPDANIKLNSITAEKIIFVPNSILKHVGHDLVIEDVDSAEPIVLKQFFNDYAEHEVIATTSNQATFTTQGVLPESFSSDANKNAAMNTTNQAESQTLFSAVGTGIVASPEINDSLLNKEFELNRDIEQKLPGNAAIANDVIKDIETIDLSSFDENTLTLDKQDIADMTDANNTLYVEGDEDDDSVTATSGWTATGQQTVNGNDYDTYEATVGMDTVTLLINTDINNQTVM